jgi:hypothetical protein
MDRIVWAKAKVSMGDDVVYPQVMIVLGPMHGVWYVRVFDRAGNMLDKLRVVNSVKTRGTATVMFENSQWEIEQIGGCGCS